MIICIYYRWSKTYKNTSWQLAPYEQVFTTHRDRSEQRAAHQRRSTQMSQRPCEHLQYLHHKKELVAAGVKEQVRELVREQHAHRHLDLHQLLSLNLTGNIRATCTEDKARTRSMAFVLFLSFVSVLCGSTLVDRESKSGRISMLSFGAPKS
jgi:hypothetical protein